MSESRRFVTECGWNVKKTANFFIDFPDFHIARFKVTRSLAPSVDTCASVTAPHGRQCSGRRIHPTPQSFAAHANRFGMRSRRSPDSVYAASNPSLGDGVQRPGQLPATARLCLARQANAEPEALVDPGPGWNSGGPEVINDAGRIAATAIRAGVQYAIRLDLIRPRPGGAGTGCRLGGGSGNHGDIAGAGGGAERAEAEAQARQVALPVEQ